MYSMFHLDLIGILASWKLGSPVLFTFSCRSINPPTSRISPFSMQHHTPSRSVITGPSHPGPDSRSQCSYSGHSVDEAGWCARVFNSFQHVAQICWKTTDCPKNLPPWLSCSVHEPFWNSPQYTTLLSGLPPPLAALAGRLTLSTFLSPLFLANGKS